jgi:hypothetical protein
VPIWGLQKRDVQWYQRRLRGQYVLITGTNDTDEGEDAAPMDCHNFSYDSLWYVSMHFNSDTLMFHDDHGGSGFYDDDEDDDADFLDFYTVMLHDIDAPGRYS